MSRGLGERHSVSGVKSDISERHRVELVHSEPSLEYLRRHRVPQRLNECLTQIFHTRPADPLAVLQELFREHSKRDARQPVALAKETTRTASIAGNDDDLMAGFRMVKKPAPRDEVESSGNDLSSSEAHVVAPGVPRQGARGAAESGEDRVDGIVVDSDSLKASGDTKPA